MFRVYIVELKSFGGPIPQKILKCLTVYSLPFYTERPISYCIITKFLRQNKLSSYAHILKLIFIAYR